MTGRRTITSGSLPWWWALIIGVVLLLQAWCFAYLAACVAPEARIGLLSLSGGDHDSYIGAMEHYLQEGRYYFVNMNGEEVLAGRMPHYAVPYYLLRLLLPLPLASDVFVLLQVILLAYALWSMAVLVQRVTGRTWPGLVFLLIVVGSGHLAPYLNRLQPDLVGVALLMLVMCRYMLVEEHGRTRDRILLGVLLALLVVVKPYYAPLFPLILLRWWYKDRDLGKTFRSALQLGLPVLLLLMPWWIRNSAQLGRFFPFQQDAYAGYGYPPTELRLRAFISAAGEDGVVWWEPRSMACVMELAPKVPCDYAWPAHFSPSTVAGFERVQQAYKAFKAEPTPEHALRVEMLMDSVQEAYRVEHPVRYYLTNRLRLVGKFLLHPGTAYLPIHSSNPCYRAWQLPMKLACAAAYLVSLLGLVWGLVVLVRDPRKGPWAWLVPALYFILLFPLVFQAVEWRYFLAAFPFDIALLVILAAGRAGRVKPVGRTR